MKTETKESLMNYLMLIGMLIVLVSLILIIWEFYGAVHFCHSIDGKYSLQLNPLSHLCNGKEIAQIKSQNSVFWGFKADYSTETPKVSITGG